MVVMSKHSLCTPDCIMCIASNLTSINTLESCVYKQQFSLTGESVFQCSSKSPKQQIRSSLLYVGKLLFFFVFLELK